MLYLLSYNSEVTTHALGVLSSYFAWDKSVFIKPYSSLFFAISISIHSNICGNGSCFLNGLFRLYILILSCVLYKSQPSSKKDSPRTSD